MRYFIFVNIPEYSLLIIEQPVLTSSLPCPQPVQGSVGEELSLISA